MEDYKWLKDSILSDSSKLEKTDKLKTVADKLGCSLAQLAVAWCAANPKVSTVILGATKSSQLEENLKALEFVPKFTPEILAEIDEIAGSKPVVPQAVASISRLRTQYLEQ